MSTITIYGIPRSSYTWTARLVAEEKGVSHQLKPIDIGSDHHKSLNPFAKFPIMIHGDLVLYETPAICRYIDEAFDGPALQPGDPTRRAIMEQRITAHVDYYYDVLIRRIAIQRIAVPLMGGIPDEEMIKAALPLARHLLSVANEGLEQFAFLAGPEISIADFFLAPPVSYLGNIPEGNEILAGLSALKDWFTRIAARPSFAATAPVIGGG